jgi:hypothetical protein
MELLALPPELFQQVAHDLVEVAGITGAWKLRGVCRTFAAEISQDIMGKRKISDFKGLRNRDFLRRGLSRYLAARLHQPLDVNQDFLDKVQSMVEWAAVASDAKTAVQRDKVAVSICAALDASTLEQDLYASPLSPPEQGLLHALECNPVKCSVSRFAWSKHELNLHDKLICAASIKRYDLVEKILPELCRATEATWSIWVVFRPFQIGIACGDAMLLDVTFRFLKTLLVNGRSTLQDCLQTTVDIIRSFSIDNAVLAAILSDRKDHLQQLLAFSEQHLPCPQRYLWDSWVYKAMTCCKDGFTKLLDFKPSGKSMITRQNVDVVYRNGTAQMIRDLTKRRDKDINTGSIITLPIFVAVRLGRPLTVEALIDAGADVDIEARSNIRSLSKDHLTPLDVALYHHQVGVLDVLLKHGAGPLPHIAEWPQHRRTFNELRRIVLRDSGVDLPTLKQFRALTLEKRNAIVH